MGGKETGHIDEAMDGDALCLKVGQNEGSAGEGKIHTGKGFGGTSHEMIEGALSKKERRLTVGGRTSTLVVRLPVLRTDRRSWGGIILNFCQRKT